MNIRKKFKRYGLPIIIFFIFIILNVIELPFYIKKTGGLINIADRLEIENKHINGSYNLAYVSEIKATIPIYMIALLNKNWDIIKKEEEVPSQETIKDVSLRNQISLNNANKVALIVAYQKANKSIKIIDENVIVVYIDKIGNTNLKIGDKIIEIDGIKIKNSKVLSKIIKKHNLDDKVKIKVENNGQILEKYAKVIEYENEKIIGIIAYDNYEIDNKEVEFNFNKTESGASGGLMMSLAIYDYITSKDLAKGRKIAGTGTINIDGEVGAIDGIKYKIKGAIKEKADIFFVPKDNYEEAFKLVNDNDLNIELVKVNSIDDAINYLKD